MVDGILLIPRYEVDREICLRGLHKVLHRFRCPCSRRTLTDANNGSKRRLTNRITVLKTCQVPVEIKH